MILKCDALQCPNLKTHDNWGYCGLDIGHIFGNGQCKYFLRQAPHNSFQKHTTENRPLPAKPDHVGDA